MRVRIGLHTGTPLVTAEGYVGADVHRAARRGDTSAVPTTGESIGKDDCVFASVAAIERDTGPERYAVLCAKGAALSPDDVVELVVRALD
jgi:hypothetical protein